MIVHALSYGVGEPVKHRMLVDQIHVLIMEDALQMEQVTFVIVLEVITVIDVNLRHVHLILVQETLFAALQTKLLHVDA